MPNITINSLDGSQIEAYEATPKNGNGPGLIILHEIFGVSLSIKKLCDHYASLGYYVICPNLFWRDVKIDQASNGEPDWEQATKLYSSFDTESGVRDIFAILAHLRQSKTCNGKVGVLGYCLGSRLSYLMSTRSDVDCSVGYYCVGIDSFLDEVHDIRMPAMAHIAAQDKLVPDFVLKKVLRSLSRNEAIKTHIYESVDHGFARDGDAKYNQEATDMANERTEAFLKEILF